MVSCEHMVYVICFFCYVLFNKHLCTHELVVGLGTQFCTLFEVWGGWELGCWLLTRKLSVRRGSGVPSTDGPRGWLHTTEIRTRVSLGHRIRRSPVQIPWTTRLVHNFWVTIKHTQPIRCSRTLFVLFHPRLVGWDGKGFLKQLHEFYFTTGEKKILENYRWIVPNFMNDYFI